MLPEQLVPESFDAYPPDARRLAISRIALLRRLPIGFVSQILRELIVYDWKFPAERRELDGQFAYLQSLAPPQLAAEMGAFAQLKLTAALEKSDWVNGPAMFTEQLTAHLWSTHQIDAFRRAAVEYMKRASAASPEEAPSTHRLGIAVIGQGVQSIDYRLFRSCGRTECTSQRSTRPAACARSWRQLARGLRRTRCHMATGTSTAAGPFRRLQMVSPVFRMRHSPLRVPRCRAACRRYTSPASSTRRLSARAWLKRNPLRSG